MIVLLPLHGYGGMKLNVTIDTKKCGAQKPFDVLEKMMEIIASAKKQPANVE